MFFDHVVCVSSDIQPQCQTMRFWVKYILLSLRIYCTNTVYTHWYYLFIGEKILGKTRHTHVDLSSLWSIVREHLLLWSYTTAPIYSIIYYSGLSWVLSLIDLSTNSRSINFISNALKSFTTIETRILMCSVQCAHIIMVVKCIKFLISLIESVLFLVWKLRWILAIFFYVLSAITPMYRN